ncbi:MAG: alpha/beta hydrolase [Agriterribacter sp.]
MKYYFCGFLLVINLIACNKETTTPPPVDNDPDLAARNITDTSYGADPLQKVDIYLPEKRNDTTKTIVLIHGGGWTEGDKSDLNTGIAGLQGEFPGYAICNINYRLAKDASTNLFPTQENDIKAAMALLLDNIQQFHISKNVVMIGFSAGAHLALLHSYKNDPDKHVKAVVDFFGPTDLPAFWNMGLVYQLILLNVTGKTYDQDQNVYTSASPVNYITAQTPPTIVLQGGADVTVPPAQADILVAALEKNHVTNQLVLYPTEGHGWQGANLLDSYQKVKAFVEANEE